MSSATSQVVPDLLEVLDAVEGEDLKPCYKSEKYLISPGRQPIIYKLFKDFTNHRQKASRAVGLSCRPFPNILKSWITDEIFQQSGIQDPFRQVLRRT